MFYKLKVRLITFLLLSMNSKESYKGSFSWYRRGKSFRITYQTITAQQHNDLTNDV